MVYLNLFLILVVRVKRQGGFSFSQKMGWDSSASFTIYDDTLKLRS
jgi:hypothetical protein